MKTAAKESSTELLILAIKNDDSLLTIQKLISDGADLGAIDKNGNSVLHLAAMRMNFLLLGFLIMRGESNINAYNTRGDNAISLILANLRNPEILRSRIRPELIASFLEVFNALMSDHNFQAITDEQIGEITLLLNELPKENAIRKLSITYIAKKMGLGFLAENIAGQEEFEPYEKDLAGLTNLDKLDLYLKKVNGIGTALFIKKDLSSNEKRHLAELLRSSKDLLSSCSEEDAKKIIIFFLDNYDWSYFSPTSEFATNFLFFALESLKTLDETLAKKVFSTLFDAKLANKRHISLLKIGITRRMINGASFDRSLIKEMADDAYKKELASSKQLSFFWINFYELFPKMIADYEKTKLQEQQKIIVFRAEKESKQQQDFLKKYQFIDDTFVELAKLCADHSETKKMAKVKNCALLLHCLISSFEFKTKKSYFADNAYQKSRDANLPSPKKDELLENCIQIANLGECFTKGNLAKLYKILYKLVHQGILSEGKEKASTFLDTNIVRLFKKIEDDILSFQLKMSGHSKAKEIPKGCNFSEDEFFCFTKDAELFSAALNGNCEKIDELLRLAANPNCKGVDEITPFFLACSKGNLAAIESFLRCERLDPNAARRDKGFSPLHIIAQDCQIEALKLLLEDSRVVIDARTSLENGARNVLIVAIEGPKKEDQKIIFLQALCGHLSATLDKKKIFQDMLEEASLRIGDEGSIGKKLSAAIIKMKDELHKDASAAPAPQASALAVVASSLGSANWIEAEI